MSDGGRAADTGVTLDVGKHAPATQRLFAPLAGNYARWATILSLGQDPRWRRALVAGLDLPPGARVLDVAAGTGLITEALAQRGWRPVALDVTRPMVRHARARGFASVEATAERLPFADGTFDAVTSGYLLRYVESPVETLRELARVVRPGGQIGMLDFGRPEGPWGPPWWLYTRIGLPVAGAIVDRIAGGGWRDVGRFLGPSIDGYYRRHPAGETAALWEAAGLRDVRVRRMSLGGGLVVWGGRP